MGWNEGGGSKHYFRPKDGAFVGKVGGAVEEHYAYTGHITRVTKKLDNYKGQENTKIEVEFEDGDEKVVIQFYAESWFSMGFFARVEGIDFSRPVTIGCSKGEDPESKVTFCWVKQGDVVVKKRPDFPTPKTVEVNKKPIKDFAEVMDEIDMLLRYIEAALRGEVIAPRRDTKPAEAPTSMPPPTKAAPTKKAPRPNEAIPKGEGTGDLPF